MVKAVRLAYFQSSRMTESQLPLFEEARRRKLNRTDDGELACAFGTPWLEHELRRADYLTGCKGCDDETRKTESLS